MGAVSLVMVMGTRTSVVWATDISAAVVIELAAMAIGTQTYIRFAKSFVDWADVVAVADFAVVVSV